MEIARQSADILVLSYVVTGRIDDIRVPPVVTPIRSDELWRHTCFEAFVGTSTGPEYYEFNFAPSTQWAAYRFSGYRKGMCAESEIGPPRIEVHSNGACYELQALLALEPLPHLPNDAVWRLGLSAVIEETSGRRSHWALAHPPGKADFHHSDCFAHELPAA